MQAAGKELQLPAAALIIDIEVALGYRAVTFGGSTLPAGVAGRCCAKQLAMMIWDLFGAAVGGIS